MMNGSRQQGHVRYPLYNAYKNETLKKRGKRENLMGKPPPQSTMHKKKQKNEKEQKAVAKQLCPSLHEDLATVQVCAH
jgi:hypothetical protein